MKRILIVAVTALAAFAVVPVAAADNDPFPSTKAPAVFLAAQTVTPDGAISSSFAPGSTVVFRAYAVDPKSKKTVTKAKFFYVTIPNQPNVKLKYNPQAQGASGLYAWTGTWTVPASYPTGNVSFKVLVKTLTKRIGAFVQMPVASAVLTILAKPQTPLANGPAAVPASSSTVDLGIYVDSVNGTGPKGTAPRPLGCTQTNVYKRGEQFVLRSWGNDLSTGALLTNDNVTEAHYAVPGQPNVTLNWGAHGTVGSKVFFWSGPWAIPADYPLGDVTITVSYTLTSGKVGTFDYRITIIP